MISVVIGGDPNWADVAMLVVQTAGLVAAGLAYWQLKTQVRLQREEMHSGLRPLVVVSRARLRERGGQHYVEIMIENVGPGSALNVEILGWLHPVEAAHFAPAAREEIDVRRRNVDLDDPEFRSRLGAMGPGRKLVRTIDIARVAPPNLMPDQARSFAYMAKYTDVYDVKYPRAPREKWEAGHVTLDLP